MKKLSLFFYLACISLFQLNAQTVNNVDFVQIQKDQTIEITYNLISNDSNQSFDVSVYLSKDGGITFQSNPLEEVSGDVGQNVTPGANKKIIWDVFNEQELEGKPEYGDTLVFKISVTIEISVRRVKEEVEKLYILGYKGSFTAPFGIVAGRTGKPGFYLSARINQNIFIKSEYETDGNTLPAGNWIFVPDVKKIQRLSVTAGILFKVGSNIQIMAGGGFAKYNLLWQIQIPYQPSSNEWILNTSESFNSFEAEAGIMLQLKQFFLSAGLASPGFKWAEATFAAGIVL